MKRVIATVATAAVLSASAAVAAPVVVQSYDMRNGETGTFNYWDDTYDGAGSTTTDGAALSGGVGDLTDGVIATQRWNIVEAPAGAGPYVGWRLFDPTIVFNFANVTAFNSMTIHFDDADGFGGVDHISNVAVAGFGSFAFGDPGSDQPTSLTIDLTGLVSDTVQILLSGANEWIFVSEITFDAGAAPVPLPAAFPLMAAGLGGLGWASRRKKKSA